MEFRLQPVVRVTSFDEERRDRPALRYWLSRPPESAWPRSNFCGDSPMDLALDFDEFIGPLSART